MSVEGADPAAELEALLAAARLKPLDPSLRLAIGNLQQTLGRTEAALESYRLAAILNPRLAEVHHNTGAALLSLGRADEALAAFRKAVGLNPDLAQSYRSMGALLQTKGQFDEALDCYARALTLSPDDPASHADVALCYLRLGRLPEGFREFEWRWKIDPPKPLNAPLWLGDAPLQGKTILLHSEQGLGDTVQFCRLVPRVAEMGATILLGAPLALVDLLSALPGVARVSPLLDQLPPFDYHCPIMSLPLAFGLTLDTIPWSGPYLGPDPVREAQWRERLGPRTARRIGIAWSGNPLHKNDRNRSLSLTDFLSGLPDGQGNNAVEYHVLLNKVSDEDRALIATRTDIISHDGAITSLSDTAALCAQLDGVVSVDTSLAHLAGAMGLPVWILLPQPADWRWMIDRTDSLWYPSATLVRQPTQGDWQGALARLRQAMDAFLKA